MCQNYSPYHISTTMNMNMYVWYSCYKKCSKLLVSHQCASELETIHRDKKMKLFVIFFAIFISSAYAGVDKLVFCYFTNWAWARSGIASYKPENIDGNLCTHIFYAFAILNETTMEIQSPDIQTDIENKFYEQVTALKTSNGIKVLISMGGWGDSAGAVKYGRLLTDTDAQSKFISSVIKFIGENNFDGLDLDLEVSVLCHLNTILLIAKVIIMFEI